MTNLASAELSRDSFFNGVGDVEHSPRQHTVYFILRGIRIMKTDFIMVKGDITKNHNVDAIVNAANNNTTFGLYL